MASSLEQITSLAEYNEFVKVGPRPRHSLASLLSADMQSSSLQTTDRGLVYFRADWAQPCAQMDTVVATLQRMHGDDIAFRCVQVDAAEWVLADLDVTHVPAVVLCAHGRVVGRVDGARAAELTQRTTALAAVSEDDALEASVKVLMRSATVVVFMKGTPDTPRCGFSRQLVGLLRGAGIVFKHIDVLMDQEVREHVKKVANWPTFPQLYAHGKLLGGLDIAREFADAGDLVKEIERLGGKGEEAKGDAAAAAAGKPVADKKASEMTEKADSAVDAAVEENGLSKALNKRLKSLIAREPVMLFMKGSPEAPQCGFSRKVVALLKEHDVEGYGHFNILEDQEVRQGLKKFSNWPTFPQIYVKGELIGGLDIAKELAASGALRDELSVGPQAAEEAPKAETLNDRLKKLVGKAPVVVFMKGNPDAPRCGFSREIVGLLREQDVTYTHFDILQDEEVRQGLKKFSNWPTYPQIYAGGELVGGIDIAKELVAASTLRSELGIE